MALVVMATVANGQAHRASLFVHLAESEWSEKCESVYIEALCGANGSIGPVGRVSH